MSETVLLLYVPGIHRGYIELFEKYRGRASTLYLFDQDILDEFPILRREIRAISPAVALQILAGAGFFPEVKLANRETLGMLNCSNATIVMSQEEIADEVKRQYLSNAVVVQEPVFLRFDAKAVAVYGEPEYDCQITDVQFYRDVLRQAERTSEQSADWFRQVGAGLIFNDPFCPPQFACNRRMPANHDTWLAGDPRMYVPYQEQQEVQGTGHAEKVLIATAARQGMRTLGASLVVTVYPCPDCQILIVLAGIVRVYFKTGYARIPHQGILKAHDVEVIKII